LDVAKRLLQGKWHEDEVDDLPEKDQNKAISQVQQEPGKEDGEGLSRLERQIMFWTDLHKMEVRGDHEGQHHFEDEIPLCLRREFGMPEDMSFFQINFSEIRKADASKKKMRPTWSGQDVLPDRLDHAKSQLVVESLNAIRVWPAQRSKGFLKRSRFLLRILVKSSSFESLMTLMVLLNTITLALERHGMEQEEEDLLARFDVWFTYVFIVEMCAKLLAIGVKKYLLDRMNWLDGFVVLLSVFEMVYKEAMSGTMDLAAFKTLRLFRTFRVFRVMRILRALKSMQMIIRVMANSYMSFLYITMLMFLFIYIFALLGMSVFGATLNFPDGTPRSNFDDMTLSVVTTFQILTMENWQTILFSLMRGDNNKFLVSIFLVSWIFLGNFILLNLFLAILLDSFLEEEEEEQADAEEVEALLQEKSLRAARRQQKRDADKVLMLEHGTKKRKRTALQQLIMGEDKYESEELEDLDEEQIIGIFKSQGIIKKGKDDVKQLSLFVGPPPIESAMSLYIFSKQNPIRIAAYRLYKQPAWDNTIIVLIILSSLKLASDTYLPRTTPRKGAEEDVLSFEVISEYLDDFFNIAFIIELCVKVVAMGLAMDGGSYLRESWNQLDFFIVMSSIVDMSLSGSDEGSGMGFVKILRLLRVLRPLRMIARNPDLKLMVSALLESVGHILNVLVVVAVIYLIFAILGVNLFQGKFFYCSIDPLQLHEQVECELAGGRWLNRDHNFDSVVSAFNTLLIVASLEGWPDIMFYAADTTAIDKGPKVNDSMAIAAPFFLVYIMLGSFFLLNFFIGVLFVKFAQAKRESQKGLKPKDLSWMDIQRLILTAEPDYETTNVPENPRRKTVHDLVCTK